MSKLDFLNYFTLFLSLAYAVFLSSISFAWKKARSHPPPSLDLENLPSVSIIVPARNEVKFIQPCIKAILRQDYPKEKIEVIVIDDHSTDQTIERIAQITDPRLKRLSLSDDTGKKAALKLGISNSKNNFLLTTDADCIAPSAWVRSFATAWQINQQMVLAPVRISPAAGFLNAFQGLDVAGTLLLTGASVYWKRPLLANGANLGFTKAAFQQVGGYSGNEERASGDDVFLLQKIKRQSVDQITFLYHKPAMVDTAAASTWTALFWQRLRWASKTDAYQDRYLILFQAAVFLFCSLLSVLPLLLLAFAQPLWYWFVAFSIKLFADFFYLRYTCKQIGYQGWMRWFLPAQLLHTLYVFCVGCLAILPLKFYWKDRKLR